MPCPLTQQIGDVHFETLKNDGTGVFAVAKVASQSIGTPVEDIHGNPASGRLNDPVLGNSGLRVFHEFSFQIVWLITG